MTPTWDTIDEFEHDAAGLHEPEAVEAKPGGMTRTTRPRPHERPVAVLASVMHGRTCLYFGAA